MINKNKGGINKLYIFYLETFCLWVGGKKEIGQ